jgi:hypothetical protein
MSHESHSDPLEFVRNMWGNMGFSLPGMVTPTMDVDELDKRITDMKAVEGWLKMNLNMLQMSIQGLEMQRATLMTIRHMGEAVRRQAEAPPDEVPEDAAPNPFAAWSAWMNSQMAPAAEAPGEAEPEPEAPRAEAEASPASSQAAADAANAFANAAAAATNAAAAAMWPWQLMGEQAGKAEAAQPAKKAPARRSTAKRTTTAKSPAAKTTKPAAAKKPASAPKAAATRTAGTTAARKKSAPAKKA